MSLAAGTSLGPYEILAPIGAGGMGEVYRARDTKLDRDVALKVLTEAFTHDPERLARFEREAKTLASLNHPHIAAIYAIEKSGETHALVMELVEGEDLSHRMARGAIPLDEALPIAKQIAEALEAAHEQGIIHRDLKPANIKVRADGTVKVLDFGLAKAMDPAGHREPGAEALSPTITSPAMTRAGVILGTAAYMSPEQAKGRVVDKRADIWAFGVVFYEMLTGRRLFDGETISETLAAVLKDEIVIGSLPPTTPPAIRQLLRRLVDRNPRNRLHDIADARVVLEEQLAGAHDFKGDATPAASHTSKAIVRRVLPWIVGATGLIFGIGSLAVRGPRPETSLESPAVVRLLVPLPDDAPLFVQAYPGRSLALSPDGTHILYATTSTSSDTRLRLRRLADTEIHAVPGTEGGRAPFFSPDGESVAFFHRAEGALKRIPIRGGRAVTVARGFANAGWMLGSWCDDGRIVFDTWNAGLRVVDGEGGSPRVLTEPTDEWHLDPQPLPGGCRVLFYTHRNEGQTIEAISADGGGRTRILDNASHGRFLASGHLLFVRDGALHLAPFDAATLKVTGPAVGASFEVVMDSINAGAPNPQLAISRNGTLVYALSDERGTSESPLVAVSFDGRVEELGALPFRFPALALSPDGERLAVTGRRSGRARVESLDLKRRAMTTLVDLGQVDMPASPVWTPDGRAIIYTRYGPFEGEIVRHDLDGSIGDKVLLRLPGTYLCPWSISPDGRLLVVSRYVPATGGDLLLVDLAAGSVKPLVSGEGNQYGAAISPDGDWLAYVSESGRRELFVQEFPAGGQKTRVTSLDPDAAIWSATGQELYFTQARSQIPGARDVMAVRVDLGPTLRVSEPRRLFSGHFAEGADMGKAFSLAPDGRFLMVRSPQGQATSVGYASRSSTQLLVVQNWFEELRAKTEGK